MCAILSLISRATGHPKFIGHNRTDLLHRVSCAEKVEKSMRTAAVRSRCLSPCEQRIYDYSVDKKEWPTVESYAVPLLKKFKKVV